MRLRRHALPAGLLAGAVTAAAACASRGSFDLGGSPPPTGSATPTSSSTPGGTPTPVPSPNPATLWYADFETGDFSEFSLGGGGGPYGNYGTASAAVNAGVAHTGVEAAQFSVTTPPAGSGIGYSRTAEFASHPGADLYFSGWFYLPVDTTTTASYRNLMYFYSHGIASDTETISVGISGGGGGAGSANIYVYSQQASTNYASAHAVPIATWFRVDVLYNCSATGLGRVTVWVDNTKIADQAAALTNLATQNCGVAWVYETDGVSPSPASVLMDDLAISTSKLP